MPENTITDFVLSYVVTKEGTDEDSYKPLAVALEKGYRVLDVFTTPMPIGGAGSGPGPVVVTVLLTKPSAVPYYNPANNTS